MSVSNRIAATQKQASVSNSIERAVLEKAMDELRSGATFKEVAERYSETPEEGDVWGEYLLEEVDEDEELVAWLKDAKDGDVSGILELDDGYSVVKVLSRHPEELPPGAVQQPRDVWTVARISRKCYDGLPEKTRDEIVESLLRRRNNALQKRVGDAIMADAVIEWPHGTNLFENVENEKKE
jgi:parvulin-like peptidyl-prolyl isomerase